MVRPLFFVKEANQRGIAGLIIVVAPFLLMRLGVIRVFFTVEHNRVALAASGLLDNMSASGHNGLYNYGGTGVFPQNYVPKLA